MTLKIKKIILILSFFVAPLLLKAQPPGPPGGGGGGPSCWPPPCVPINNGITILLIAGLLYGSKKIYNYNKHEKEAE